MTELAPAHFRAVLQTGSKSFSFASRFLSGGRRNDAAVLYTFCRAVDDIADETTDPEFASKELAAMADELRGLRPARAEVDAFLEVAQRRRIDVKAAHHLIEGALSDLHGVCIRTDGELLRYAYQVAGTVGLMMCGVLGVRDPDALPFAVDLGIAMQLTNILRDVKEDALRNRIYLPATRLEAAGVEADRLLWAARHEQRLSALPRVVQGLAAWADSYYRSGDRGLRYIPTRPRWAILVASRVYRQIGRRLIWRFGADPLHGRTVVPLPEKLWVAGAAIVSGLGPEARGWTAAPSHDPELHACLVGLPGANARAQPLTPQLEAVT